MSASLTETANGSHDWIVNSAHQSHAEDSAAVADASTSCAVSDADAIAMAQLSIDCCQQSSTKEAGEKLQNDDIKQLAAILEFLGCLGLEPSAKYTKSNDAPMMIGRFEVRSEQGRGGFGIVLRAFDPVLQREVALKIPRPERLLEGQSPNDFIHEAQMAARLEHPGIVRVYETRRLAG